MVWTEATRRQFRRGGLRYASNLTDAEWALIKPFMPAARWIVSDVLAAPYIRMSEQRD